ncbi:MAG: TonB-dependent receptor [Gemmatimonadetes bacterium]|nr:TonB-dependent receptor [Gemmatimonadota bacterium]
MRFFVVWFAVVLYGPAATAPVVAQQPAHSDSAQALADSLRNGKPFSLSPIIVTASVAPIRQDRIGFTAAVLRDDELAAEPMASAGVVLRRLPDIFVDEGAGPGGPAVLRIRGGEETYTKVLWDGVPININGGFLDIQGLTLSNVERVEVARGPQSALYGSSAVTGVVQFITRSGRIGRPTLDAAWEGGAATQKGQVGRGEVAIRGGVPGLLYSAGGAAAYDRGIFTVAHNAWTKEGSLRLDAVPAARVTVTGITRYADIRTNLPVRDPGATRVPLDPNQRDSRERWTSSVAGTYQVAPSWTHKVSGSLLRDVFYYGDKSDGVSAADFFVPDFTLTDRNSTRRMILEYTGTNRVPGSSAGDLAVSYGASIEHEVTGDELTGDFGDSNLELARTSRALFSEVQTGVGARLSLLAGTRLEKFHQLPVQLTPRAAAVLAIAPDRLLLRGAVGRAFKTPNLQQQFLDNPFTVPNPDLAPESGLSWEVGTEFIPGAGGVRASATYFRQAYRNLIRTVAADNDPRQTNKNLGRSRAEGVELELLYQVSPRFRVGGNGTWLRTVIQDNSGLPPDQYPVGGELPFRPHLMGTAYAEISGGRAAALLRATVTGRQTVLTERFSGQRALLDGYSLLGLTLSYEATRTLSLHVTGDNLLNTYYLTGFDKRGVPLRMTAGVRFTP